MSFDDSVRQCVSQFTDSRIRGMLLEAFGTLGHNVKLSACLGSGITTNAI